MGVSVDTLTAPLFRGRQFLNWDSSQERPAVNSADCSGESKCNRVDGFSFAVKKLLSLM